MFAVCTENARGAPHTTVSSTHWLLTLVKLKPHALLNNMLGTILSTLTTPCTPLISDPLSHPCVSQIYSHHRVFALIILSECNFLWFLIKKKCFSPFRHLEKYYWEHLPSRLTLTIRPTVDTQWKLALSHSVKHIIVFFSCIAQKLYRLIFSC